MTICQQHDLCSRPDGHSGACSGLVEVDDVPDCNGETCGAVPCVCANMIDDDGPPTLEHPLGIGAATEMPASSSLYPPTCFACGQATSGRDTSITTDAPLPRIATMSHRAVDDEIERLLDEAGPDERRITLFMLRRFIALGQRCYGMLDLETDKRNGLRELNEELADALFYVSFDALRRQLHQRR